MMRLLQGWTITNGLGILWKDGRVDQVLLDEPGTCFPDPTGLAITPDGRLALVTSSGSNRVAVVDIQKLMAVVEAASDEERARRAAQSPGQGDRVRDGTYSHRTMPARDRCRCGRPDGLRRQLAGRFDQRPRPRHAGRTWRGSTWADRR